MEELGTEDRNICALPNVDAVEAQGMGLFEVVDAALGGESSFDIEALKDVYDLVGDTATRIGEYGEKASGLIEFFCEVLNGGSDLTFGFLGADTVEARMGLGVCANRKTVCSELSEVFPTENIILGWGYFEDCGELVYSF